MFLSGEESAIPRESSTSGGMQWPGDSQRSAEAHLHACLLNLKCCVVWSVSKAQSLAPASLQGVVTVKPVLSLCRCPSILAMDVMLSHNGRKRPRKTRWDRTCAGLISILGGSILGIFTGNADSHFDSECSKARELRTLEMLIFYPIQWLFASMEGVDGDAEILASFQMIFIIVSGSLFWRFLKYLAKVAAESPGGFPPSPGFPEESPAKELWFLGRLATFQVILFISVALAFVLFQDFKTNLHVLCFVCLFLGCEESAVPRESSTSSGMQWPGDSLPSAEAHLPGWCRVWGKWGKLKKYEKK